MTAAVSSRTFLFYPSPLPFFQPCMLRLVLAQKLSEWGGCLAPWHLDALVVKHQIINLLNCQLCKHLKNCGFSCHSTFQFCLIFIQILAVRHHLWQCCMESKPGKWEKLSEIQQKGSETKKCSFSRSFLCIQLKVWSSQKGLIWIC